MSIDGRIHDAVYRAVQEAEQPEQVAHQIISWLEAVAEGSEDFDDRNRRHVRLENLFAAVDVEEAMEAED